MGKPYRRSDPGNPGGQFMHHGNPKNRHNNNNHNYHGNDGQSRPYQNFGRGGRGRGGGRHDNGGRGRGTPGGNQEIMKSLLSVLVDNKRDNLFNQASGLLDISSMKSDENLKGVNVDFNTLAFCKTLCEVLQKKFSDGIRFISLENNNISEFSFFLSALMETKLYMGITAINASNNNIRGLRHAIVLLKQFPSLRELMFVGNPVVQYPAYGTEIARGLPRLLLLDQIQVPRNALTLQNPIFPELDQMRKDALGIVETNIHAPMNRPNETLYLEGIYSENSIFSISTVNIQNIIPQQIPRSEKLGTDLSPELMKAMNTDFRHLRERLHWRNLDHRNNRNAYCAVGQEAVMLKLKEFTGEMSPVNIELNTRCISADELFLGGKKVIIGTVHGWLRYYWNKMSTSTPPKRPFLACFFERTFTWTEDSGYKVANDIIHLRPDAKVFEETNPQIPASPVFDAFSSDRLERLRSTFLPLATIPQMYMIVESVFSKGIYTDFAIQQLTFQLHDLTPNIEGEALRQLLEQRIQLLMSQ